MFQIPLRWKSRFGRALKLPHLLGIDAALVASAWQALVSRSAGHPECRQLTASLFFAVWAIYLADRIWDTWRDAPQAPRHRFARRHRMVLGLLAAASLLLAAAFAATATPKVSSVTWVPLGFVAVLCVGYCFARAGFPEWERGRAVVVGGVFAAGTLLAVPGLGGGLFCRLALALGALFTANVRICIWSEAWRDQPLQLLRPLALSALGFLAAASGGHWQIALAGLMSLAGLWALVRMRRKINTENLAMAADAALFAPPLIVLSIWLGS